MTAAIILGESIGSHQIDRAFQNLVDSYLRDLPDQYSDFGDSLQDITESTDFQDAKHNLRKKDRKSVV